MKYLPPADCKDALVEKCIEELFHQYRENPIRYLREVGIQFQMRTILQGALNREECLVEIFEKGGKDACLKPSCGIDRVQLEIRVSGMERSDLVILRSTRIGDRRPISLTLYPNGALDLVSKIPPGDIDCAFEIKAACSADPEQRHKFRKDICKLWRIAKKHESISTHFILVDKSVGFGEFSIKSLPPVAEWHSESKKDISKWGVKARKDRWVDYLDFTFTKSPPLVGPYVSVWGFDGVSIVRKYAVGG